MRVNTRYLQKINRRFAANNEKSSDLKKAFFNGSVFLAVAIGLLYLNGFIFLTAYYKYFRIPIHLINPDFYTVLIYGFTEAILLLTIVAGFLFILPYFSKIAEDLRRFKPLYKFLRALTDVYQEALKHKSLYALVAVLFLYLLIESLIHTGREGINSAKNYATDGGTVVKIEYKDSRNMPSVFGYVHHNGNQYILFDITKKKESIPDVYIIDRNEIKQLKIIGTVRDTNKLRGGFDEL